MHYKGRFFKFLTIVVIAIVCCWNLNTMGQIVVTKKVTTLNPTIYFKGITGNPQLSRLILSDLKHCGWFRVISSNNAKYSIKGTQTGNRLLVSLFSKSGKILSLQTTVSPKTMRTTAHKLVDSFLKKLFNIKGICNSKIAFTLKLRTGVKNIYISDFDGKQMKAITNYATLCVEPAWGPHNKSIIYTQYGANYTNIIEVKLSNGSHRRLSYSPGLNSSGTISPSGDYLAMVLSRDDQVELYLKALNGAGLRRLTRSQATEASPTWDRTGTKLCYVSDLSGRPALYIMDLAMRRITRLSTYGVEAVSPSWSTNGQIAYSARTQGHYVIAIKNLNNNNKSRIVVQDAGNWESPSWAPDNRHLICSRELNHKKSLYIVDTFTGRYRKLFESPYSLSLPSWSPLF